MKKKIQTKEAKKPGLGKQWYALLVLIALGVTLIVEFFNHKVFTDGFADLGRFLARHPLAFIVNFLIVLLTLTPVIFVKRRTFWTTLIGALWVVGGGVNGFILLNRMTPFTTADLTVLNTGLATLPNYLSTGYIILLGVAFVAVIVLLVLLYRRGRKNQVPFKRRLLGGLLSVVIAAAALLGGGKWASEANQLSTFFANLAFAYDDYGFAYCFLQTWLNKGIHRPYDYSQADMERIAHEIEENYEEAGEQDAMTDVNVIFVQLESFIDPALIKGLKTNIDALPVWHELKERCSSGYLHVPVVGAGTANTEFEVLTGMASSFFGPGEYPYKTCLQDQTIESVAYDLAAVGYATHAIHNHRATFYSRHLVYANLGFDDFTSLEYMTDVEKTQKNWAKDYVLTDQIESALDVTEDRPDLVFTVSVQGHGKYPTEPLLEDPPVLVKACPEHVDSYAVEYYLNMIHEMDEFIGQLTQMLSERDEKTILVLYGDHLPALNLENADMESGSEYDTEYIIWDNFGLKAEDQELYSYQLSAAALEKIGITEGKMTKFHQFCRLGPAYYSDLKKMQYDILYGNSWLNDGTHPYEAADMQMGILPITINTLFEYNGSWYVFGENFTSSCKVKIDGDVVGTEYISDHVLRLKQEPETTDYRECSIVVRDKHKEVLSDEELD